MRGVVPFSTPHIVIIFSELGYNLFLMLDIHGGEGFLNQELRKCMKTTLFQVFKSS
jgi:hypothetical protein